MTNPPETGLFRGSRGGRFAGILGVYAASAYAVLQVVDLLADNLGLPAWVFPAALALLIVGLPIILTTALVHDTARRAGTTHRWLTWRRVLLGVVASFVALGLAAGGYLGLRAAGIGPFGSLVAKGEIDASDRILIADFSGAAGESVLAGVLTEAFRIDFAQSTIVRTPERATLQEALARMERDPAATIDFDLARELAEREGIPAVLAGEVGRVGLSYVIGVRLVAVEDGRDLAAFRETAADSTQLIPALDRLSKKMRERIGESLLTIHRSDALARVTTASLPALRRYTEATRALEVYLDQDRGIALLEEAVRLDTAFAMAWRKLGVALGNNFEARERELDAVTRAWQHRDRLTPRERYMTEGTYYTTIGDARAAMRAYESLLEQWPSDAAALNNLAWEYFELRDYEQGEALMRRAVEADSNSAIHYMNLAEARLQLGRIDAAEATLQAGVRRLPGAALEESLAGVALARGEYERADSLYRTALEAHRSDTRLQINARVEMAFLAAMRGRIAEADRQLGEAARLSRQVGAVDWVLDFAVVRALLDVRLLGDTAGAARRIEAALRSDPVEGFPALQRPYLDLAWGLARAGRVRQAREYVDAYERDVDPRLQDVQLLHSALSVIAIAEHRPDVAIAEARRSDVGVCAFCAAIDIAHAFDAAGQADSAIAEYERFLGIQSLYRWYEDNVERGPALQRLGELYEAKGDAAAAASRYAELLELWNGADPVLQPRVAEIRRRLAHLTTERG